MLLEVDSLSVGHDGVPAVFNASLTVAEGEFVAIIGPNGAGKSTLINAVAGLLRWTQGSFRMDGVEMKGVPAHLFCEAGIAIVPEGRRLFTTMTVEENLEIGSYRKGVRRDLRGNLDRVYTLFPALRTRRHQIAGSLSGGQQQLVAIGRALMARPRLLLLDEPSLALGPAIVTDVFKEIQAIHAEGVTILLVEQNVAQALAIADRAYVLEEGRIVCSDKPAALMAQSRIREAYLGL